MYPCVLHVSKGCVCVCVLVFYEVQPAEVMKSTRDNGSMPEHLAQDYQHKCHIHSFFLQIPPQLPSSLTLAFSIRISAATLRGTFLTPLLPLVCFQADLSELYLYQAIYQPSPSPPSVLLDQYPCRMALISSWTPSGRCQQAMIMFIHCRTRCV